MSKYIILLISAICLGCVEQPSVNQVRPPNIKVGKVLSDNYVYIPPLHPEAGQRGHLFTLVLIEGERYLCEIQKDYPVLGENVKIDMDNKMILQIMERQP